MKRAVTNSDIQAYLSARSLKRDLSDLRSAYELGMVEEMFKNLLNDRRGFWRKIYCEEILGKGIAKPPQSRKTING